MTRRQTFETLTTDRGQTMAEYVVVLGVITVGIVLAFAALSGAVQAGIERVVGLIP